MSSAGCTCPFLGPCSPSFIYLETLGRESHSYHYLCPTKCKPSRTCKCRVTNQWRGEQPTKWQLWVLSRFEPLHAYWLTFPGQSPAVCLEVMTLPSPHTVVFHLFLVSFSLKQNKTKKTLKQKAIVMVLYFCVFESCDTEEQVKQLEQTEHSSNTCGLPAWISLKAVSVLMTFSWFVYQ